MMDIVANLFGLVGVLLLAFPAFYAAKYGRLAGSLKVLGPIDPNDTESVKIHRQALQSLTEHQGRWTPILTNSLLGGTFCAGVSHMVGLFKALMTSNPVS